jgi:3-deoxy-D-manno-octulosonic-acid transferase
MKFWYKLLTYLFYPFSYIYLFLRKIRKKEHRSRYKEKLSQIKIRRREGFLLWYHVASVGEAMSILPLLEHFKEEEKIKNILITTVTLSSAQILEKKYKNDLKIVHQFLPLDVPLFVERFLNHWSPDLSIFVDSEIWPNFIFSIKKKKIPLLLVNARITKKTFFRWKFLKSFAKEIFEKFDLCLVSNSETNNHLINLGAKNVKNLGNLKFAKNKSSHKKLDLNFINKIKNRKVWCAASTHEPEEIFCAKTHVNLKKIIGNVLTIIIPRHINRIQKIYKDLSNLNLKICLYSELNNLDEKTDIIIVDSYGEAAKLYEISKCVLLGKSLVNSLKNDSGQNPIEAARLGCAIFHGPHVSNFFDIYEYLKSLKVTKEVATTEALCKSLVEELKNNKKYNQENVEKIEKYGQDTFNNVLNEIKIYINT